MKDTKINQWLAMLWEMNKDESNKLMCELQSFLRQQRKRIEMEQRFVNEGKGVA
tara:strand:- start:2878 stop:3039 length:162 start_codon:yes stop_codon:yes gene_type:complete